MGQRNSSSFPSLPVPSAEKTNPLTWSPEEIAAHMIVKYPDSTTLPRAILRCRIDGECLLEPPQELLTTWLQGCGCPPLQINQLKTEREALLSHDLVQPYVFSEEPIMEDDKAGDTPDEKDDENGTAKPQPELTWENIATCDTHTQLLHYHKKTSHTKEQYAEAPQRMWALQPKLTRRFYGSPVLVLPLPCEFTACANSQRSSRWQFGQSGSTLKFTSSLLPPELQNDLSRHRTKARLQNISNLLYHSVSVSGVQDAMQAMICPRMFSCKRVNPSSGALHPVEVYCWLPHDDLQSISMWHYSAPHHSLELRYHIPIANTNTEIFKTVDCLLGVTSVHNREVWKYGARGWRYTQLDVGHCIGSISLTANHVLPNVEVDVISALDIKIKNNTTDNYPELLSMFALHQINNRDDIREHEHPAVLIGISTTNNNTDRIYTLIDSISNNTQTERSHLHGLPNTLFRSKSAQFTDKFINTHYHGAEIAVQCMIHSTALTQDGHTTTTTSSTTPPPPTTTSPPTPTPPTTTTGTSLVRTTHQLPNCVLQTTKFEQAVRARRSAMAFSRNPQEIPTKSHLISLLEACLSTTTAMCHNMMDEHMCLALWVHNIKDVECGLYVCRMNPSSSQKEKEASNNESGIEVCQGEYKLQQLKSEKLDKNRETSAECSCSQRIAVDCFMVISIMASSELFDPHTPLQYTTSATTIEEMNSQGKGDVGQVRRYMHQHWKAGYIGQIIYTWAEMHGMNATGMGCFGDEETREHILLDHMGHDGELAKYYPLYHACVGIGDDDIRFEPYDYASRCTAVD